MDASLDTLLTHRAWVRTLALALAGPADADDLEQEAWLAVPGFPVNPGRRRASPAPPRPPSAAARRRPFGIGFSLGLGPTPGFLHKL